MVQNSKCINVNVPVLHRTRQTHCSALVLSASESQNSVRIGLGVSVSAFVRAALYPGWDLQTSVSRQTLRLFLSFPSVFSGTRNDAANSFCSTQFDVCRREILDSGLRPPGVSVCAVVTDAVTLCSAEAAGDSSSSSGRALGPFTLLKVTGGIATPIHPLSYFE